MARNDVQLKQLKDQIERFGKFDKSNLIKRQIWGSISFESGSADFDRIYAVVNHLRLLPIELLTIDALNQIFVELQATNNVFDLINNFSIESGSPTQQRDSYLSQIGERADRLYAQASPWIPFLAYQNGDVTKNIDALTASVKEADTIVGNAKHNIEIRENEMQVIITKAREASAAAGAAVFTKDYANEAKDLKDASWKWLLAAGIIAIITICIAIYMWTHIDPGLDTGQVWQKLTTKFVILALLFTASVWCGGIYKALMHQVTVNKHRANSLQTIQAFSAAVGDLQIKDAIVYEAARATFGNVPTGYIGDESNGDGQIKMFELVKGMASKE